MSKTTYKVLWSFWFISLSLISIGLIILTVKLMEDRRTRKSLESDSDSFIQSIEDMLETESEKVARAKWAFMTNQTEVNRYNYEYVSYNYDQLVREIKLNMTAVPWESFRTSKLRRKFFLFLRSPRVSLLPPWKTAELNAIKANITAIQLRKFTLETTTTTKSTENGVGVGAGAQSGKPTLISSSSANVKSVLNSLDWTLHERDKSNWILFNELVGEETKPLHANYVKLMNENAVLSDFPNSADYWITADYEMESKAMRKIVFKLWEQIKPLYQELHGYLVDELTSRKVKYNGDGFITADLFESDGVARGDWSAFYKVMKPFPKREDLNITAELGKRKYSPQTMAQLSEDFFELNNFPTMTPDFWSESIFRISPRAPMDCRPTLYKISNNEKQLRVSLCGEKDENTFRTINKLMTQAKFVLLRQDQPFLFRYDTNSVMAVAAEEAVQMFMTSTTRLRNLGLLDNFEEDRAATINSLFQQALDVIPRMAHSLAFDKWNSKVFGGLIKPREYNCYWWAVRQKLEGVEPPVRRKSSQFDVARSAFLAAPPSFPLQNFVVSIMRFQLYKSLSVAAEEANSVVVENPNNLNIDDGHESIEAGVVQGGDNLLSLNRKAGSLLNSIVKSSSTKSWQKSLMEISNGTELNTQPLLDFFQPLYDFLKERNEMRKVKVDWSPKLSKKRLICSK